MLSFYLKELGLDVLKVFSGLYLPFQSFCYIPGYVEYSLNNWINILV